MAYFKAGLAAPAFLTGKSAVASLPKQNRQHSGLLFTALLATAFATLPALAESPQSILTEASYALPLVPVNTGRPAVGSYLPANAVESLEDSAHLQRLGLGSSPDQQAQYNVQLIQSYTALARDMAQTGDLAKAVEAYDRALHLQRTEQGLHNAVQLPLLKAQLPLLEKLARWTDYNDTVYRIVSISNRNFLPGNDNRLSALELLGHWQLKVISESLLPQSQVKTGELMDLYENEIAGIKQAGSALADSPVMTSLLLGQAVAKLAITREVISKPLKFYQGSAGDPTLTDGMPNLNYFQAPAEMKRLEVNAHLEDLRTTILEAAALLEEADHSANRPKLISDFRFLAESYTDIAALAPIN